MNISFKDLSHYIFSKEILTIERENLMGFSTKKDRIELPQPMKKYNKCKSSPVILKSKDNFYLFDFCIGIATNLLQMNNDHFTIFQSPAALLNFDL